MNRSKQIALRAPSVRYLLGIAVLLGLVLAYFSGFAFVTANSHTATPVTEDNIGDNWHVVVQDVDGSYGFVDGPETPPHGSGSLAMGAEDLSADKITILTDDFDGLAISGIEELSYWTYRNSASTSAGHVVPSLNIFISNAGPDGAVSWAPLVWEPIYPHGAEAVMDDEWQQWDAMAESETSYGGGWWSTRALGEICAFDCFVSWETVLEENPNATIIMAGEGAGSFGLNLGRGPGGSFDGNVDGLHIAMNGTMTTYDFELEAEPIVAEPPMSLGELQRASSPSEVINIHLTNNGKWYVVEHQVDAQDIDQIWWYQGGEFFDVTQPQPGHPPVSDLWLPTANNEDWDLMGAGNITIFYHTGEGEWLHLSPRFDGRGNLVQVNNVRP
jgi:hypothetical protein